MPYKDAALHKANATLREVAGSPSESVTRLIRESSLVDVVRQLDLLADLKGRNGELFVAWLKTIPESIDAVVRAALSSATERGLHAQVVWKPAAAWAVEVWEVSDVEKSSGSPIGTVTVVLSSVPPEEDREV
jgi:hypothetical protein